MKIDLSNKEIEFLIRALVCNFAENRSDFNLENITDSGICGLLIGKLSLTPGNIKHYNNVRIEKYNAKNKFGKKLFMGNGNHSTVDLNYLHKRLEFAVSSSSVMEQNGGMGEPFNQEMDLECKQNILNVIKDLILAFDVNIEDLLNA